MADSNSNHQAVDSYGFTKPDDYDVKTYDEFMNKYLNVLSHRSLRWSKYLNNNIPVKTSRKLKRFIRKGIPNVHRPLMWMFMSGAEERRRNNPELYKKLLQSDNHDPQLIEAIKNDIHRTFPDNIHFRDASSDPKTKRFSLYNVLLAVSHNNKKTGYCQGMNFISGLLLLIVKDEEKVFWLIDTLINIILPDYYAPDMMGVKVDCEVLGELIRLKCPDIFNLANKLGCAWSIVATKWFICLFVDVLPVETVLRLWDCLFFEGDKILFRACITLIKLNSAKIMKCRNFSELMGVMRGIHSDPNVIDCHSFMGNVFKETGSLSRSLITKLRQECRKKVLEDS